MTETIITVQGNFTAHYPAERATVALSLHHEAAERGPAFSATVTSSDAVQKTITQLRDASEQTIVKWSSDSIQVWTERPWTSDGQPGAIVFHARASTRVTFGDLTALAPWIEEVAAIDGVDIESVEWALTPTRLTATTTEVRSRAVQDAMTKATVYAQALGLATVRAIAVADPGMLGDQVQGTPGPAVHLSRSYEPVGGAQPALSLSPQPIEVSAAVDARFIAI